MNTKLRKASTIRMVVLGVVLLVVVVGAILEFGVNLPGHRNALDSLDAISKANQTEPKTRTDVVEALGNKSAVTTYTKMEWAGETKTIRFSRKDHYKWSRIIPGKAKMEIFVTYERYMPQTEAENAKPESFTDAEWSFRSFYEPSNAPIDVSVTAKKRKIDNVIFDMIDEDTDGFIVDKELSPNSSILKDKAFFDTNEDGKVSHEEFKVAFKKLEEQKGRPLTESEQYEFFGGKSPGEGVDGGGGAGAGGSGPGGPGGSAGGKKKGPGGGFDPAAIFDRLDANKDGKIAGDEISDRLRGRVPEMDKDKDGAVSKDEFMNAPRPQRGGGKKGKKEGTGGDKKKARPSFDEEKKSAESDGK